MILVFYDALYLFKKAKLHIEGERKKSERERKRESEQAQMTTVAGVGPV